MSSAVAISGVLVREPEIRYLRDGCAETRLAVAVAEDDTNVIFAVVCRRELAENVALSVEKGMGITVAGKLAVRIPADADGNPSTAVEIEATDVGASLLVATAEVHRTHRPSGAVAGL